MYRTSFQCPETGQMIIARYTFGKVTLEAADQEWVADGTLSPETNERTITYCKRYTNRRKPSLEAANEYIVGISDGETFGFERE